MQRLILLRHGKAESATSSDDDFERGLTDRGQRDAALMGRVLADRRLSPDLALVSAARRAQETWDAAAASFPAARARAQRGLYLASIEQLEHAAAAARDEAGVLMIVGHNPGLHEFALAHASGAPAGVLARIMDGLPTSAAAVLTVGEGGALVLHELILPRDHGGGVL